MQTNTDRKFQAFLDKQEIAEVIYRLARSIDRIDENLMRSCFHPDATDDHGSFKGTAEEFVAWVIPVLKGMVATQHNICNMIIDVDGDKAEAESYFIAHHRIEGKEGPMHVVAAGRYLDRLEKRMGNWRISHRHAIYDWSRNDPSTDQWDGPAGEALERGARWPDDPIYKR